jgi:hypothetical protein
MFIFLTRLGRLFVGITIVIAVTAIFGFNTLDLVPVASKQGANTSGCSIAPSSVSLNQTWTGSAWGLPTGGTVNMILTFPDGSQYMGTITVNSNGTITFTGNSDMSASWGFITPQQVGTYNYNFVNKLKWPAGTFTKSYATCSVVVT